MEQPFDKNGSKSNDDGIGLNVDFFMNSKNEDLTLKVENPEPGKKRGRPRKKVTDDSSAISIDSITKNNDVLNMPYADTYNETTNLLRGSIIEIDTLNTDIREQVNAVKTSKTLRKKYEYLTDLIGASSNLIGTKISAIREINNSITHAHDLEMKRSKNLKIENEMDDDKRIMDMYNAFISTPMGSYNPLGPSITDVTLAGGPISGVDIVTSNNNPNESFMTAPLTPEQNRMVMEHNPNVKTVVVYNQETGDKYFDVIDMTTGASVPNVAKPDNFLLPDTNVNLRAGTARNANIDTTWPLVVIGTNININDY